MGCRDGDPGREGARKLRMQQRTGKPAESVAKICFGENMPNWAKIRGSPENPGRFMSVRLLKIRSLSK